MPIDRPTMKRLMALITFAVLLIAAMLRFEQVLSGIQFLAGILAPFFAGGAMAFILNVLMRFVEEKLLAPLYRKGKRPKYLRAVSLLLTIALVAAVILLLLLVVLPQLYLALLSGLQSADVRLLELAEVFHVPLGRRLWYIHRPALAPQLRSACRLALGMCWKSGVAAEVIGVPAHTIGEGFYMAKISLDTPGLLAWTAALLAVSWLFQRLVLALLERLLATPGPTSQPL